MQEQHQKVAVHGLIKDGDKFLILKRSAMEDWKPGEWDIPGGSVEFGEINAKEALAREIKEEVGLGVEIREIISLYSHMSNSFRHQFQFIYSCEYKGGEIDLNIEEHDEYRWITVDEAKDLPLIAFLEDLFKNLKG